MIRRILCPTDFSEGSDRALEQAIELARELGASVVVAHVFELAKLLLPESPGMLIDPIPPAIESARRDLNALVARNADRGVAIEAALREGTPSSDLVAMADAAGADLIVMATHGRGGLARALLGSVADQIVRTSRVPVLLVRDQQSSAEAR